MIDPETEYLMTRAMDEAVLAIRAGHPAAAAAHHGLAVRYSTKAVIDLANDFGRDPKPRAPASTRNSRS
jgi:hypothetical protein